MNSTLIVFVILYLLVTIGIGLMAARRVHDIGRLPGGRAQPAAVHERGHGVRHLVRGRNGAVGVGHVCQRWPQRHSGRPLWRTVCLVLAALLFASKLFYRLNLLTIGDFYKVRYGKSVEVLTSVAIVVSYLGWTSAQLTALGLVIHVLSGGAMTLNHAIIIGAAIVLVYTVFGGMWSVAFTDLFQTVIIVIGLSLVAWLVGGQAGGFEKVIAEAHAQGKFNMFPAEMDATAWWAMAGAFLAFAFGSIPQQDVFQRMTSAKDEKTAMHGTILGAAAYLIIAAIPIYIAFAALMAHPELAQLFASEDAREIQRILPDLVLGKMPVWAQVMFFGALLSAILSTASGALLAPTATFTENVLRPFVPHMSDRQFLLTLRIILVTFTTCALLFALNSESTMYEMVQNAYNVTLTGAFVPLVAGAFWKRANTQGALFSAVLGMGVWLVANTVAPDAMIPPNLLGLAASVLGMLMGTLAPEVIRHRGQSITQALAHAGHAQHPTHAAVPAHKKH
jgi:SSS family solute:Na+ symporter